MLMNASGSLLFGIQQYVWHDQRINMKMSAFPVNYSKYNDPLIKERADKLYGTSFTESLLKRLQCHDTFGGVLVRAHLSEIRNLNFRNASRFLLDMALQECWVAIKIFGIKMI
jgi:hypothetical protein